jgi:hypothetical protein
MTIRRAVTAAKAAANKKNAEKSPGPKSTRGKLFASQNSIRHGILTRDLLLPGESAAELEQVRKELIASYGAVGSSELVQVEIVLSSEWRLRRLYRAEAGEITTILSQFNPKAEILASDHTPCYFEAIAYRSRLEEIEKKINRQADVSAENVEWLRRLPYGEPVKLFVRYNRTVAARSRPGRPSPRSKEVQWSRNPNAFGGRERGRSGGRRRLRPHLVAEWS